MESVQIDQHVEASLEALKSHDLARAQTSLDVALALDYENFQVLRLLKYLGFWRERQRFMNGLHDNLQKCHYLLQQWAHFILFRKRIYPLVDDSVDQTDSAIDYALRQFVFGQALNLLSIYDTNAGAQEPEILYLVGVGLKGIGNYEAARRFLEKANTTQKDSPAIMADLADAYALVGETDLAKVLFREAFFIDPQAVRLETLECELITSIINVTIVAGYEGAELLEWIPIYGQLKCLLTIKRELRVVEFGKLRQSIYTLEREIQEGTSERKLVLPRLINRYFWLIDHYLRSQEDQKKVRELLLKIRSLDDDIYKLYTK